VNSEILMYQTEDGLTKIETASDGKTYQVDYYNLGVIISVGYRVKSLRGTQSRFRIF